LPMAVSILRFMEQKTMQGIIWFVIASTFKIGAVFYLPATLLVITLMSGLSNVIVFVIILIGTQVAISLPFTTVNKQAYIEQNFNFSPVSPRDWLRRTIDGLRWRTVAKKIFVRT
jgi:Gpi18-like mannosyltransferase